jgi:DNA replication protein DnaC
MYARENYIKVKEMIEARRLKAISDSEARNIEVAALSEDIRIIDSELRSVGLQLFKAACSGQDITPIRERNQTLCELRKKALVKLGLPEDYTEVRYTCTDCSDSGFVGTRICKCFKELLITENIKSSGMGKLIEKQSFDNFSLDALKQDEQAYQRMKKNIDELRSIADNFSNTNIKTLLFIGKTGTGKTHISTSIAKTVIEKGYEVLYDSAQNIVAAFEHDRFKSGYGPYEPKGDKYLECDLLIMDDLGTEFVNQFTTSCLYNLINTRQNKGLSTIISTNLSPTSIVEKYDDRIYSRLMGADSKVVLFEGNDYRLYGKKI